MGMMQFSATLKPMKIQIVDIQNVDGKWCAFVMRQKEQIKIKDHYSLIGLVQFFEQLAVQTPTIGYKLLISIEAKN
jgi:hypothetical protein